MSNNEHEKDILVENDLIKGFERTKLNENYYSKTSGGFGKSVTIKPHEDRDSILLLKWLSKQTNTTKAIKHLIYQDILNNNGRIMNISAMYPDFDKELFEQQVVELFKNGDAPMLNAGTNLGVGYNAGVQTVILPNPAYRKNVAPLSLPSEDNIVDSTLTDYVESVATPTVPKEHIVNEAPKRPVVNEIPKQPVVNEVPKRPVVNEIPKQPVVNEVPKQPKTTLNEGEIVAENESNKVRRARVLSSEEIKDNPAKQAPSVRQRVEENEVKHEPTVAPKQKNKNYDIEEDDRINDF